MKWKEHGRKQPWHILRHYIGIIVEGLRKTTKCPRSDYHFSGLKFVPATFRMRSKSVNHTIATHADTNYDNCPTVQLCWTLSTVGLDDRMIGCIPAGAGNFPLQHSVQNGSGAHPASYPMGNGGSFPGGKAAGS